METKELVKALRCSATPGGAESCAGCSYRVVDRVSDEDAAKYGFVPGAEFESCDTDRMALDAADLLEKLNAERDAALKDLRGKCSVCKNHTTYHRVGACKNCYWENSPEIPFRDHWQWRGLEGRRVLNGGGQDDPQGI